MTAPVESETEAATPLRCPSCGEMGTGRYCGNCGTELGKLRDLSIKHFFKEAFTAITDVDSALVASFRSLISRPGELTATYLTGDRRRFLAPFKIFLICNVAYFLAAGQLRMRVLTGPLDMQLNQMPYGRASRAIVNKRLHMESPAMTLEAAAERDSITRAFATKYDGATEGVGKAIVVVLIPFFAVILQILYAGRRRFFVEHLTLATHVTAFLLLALAAIGPVATATYRAGVGVTNPETLFSACVLIAFSLYQYRAQRVVYDVGRASAAARAALLTLSIAPLLVAFKFVLFLVTVYWIR